MIAADARSPAMFIVDLFPRRLEAENLFLRHQLSIIRPDRPQDKKRRAQACSLHAMN
jgi:hypothetical protein